ncbi:MAG: PaaI family thioesterase [Phycisphaerae bacterium]
MKIENDKFVKHCGIELLEIQEGKARARMKVQQHHLNDLNIAHGGAIFTLADTTFAAVANSHGYDAVAIGTHTSFMKATQEGEYLYAEGTELNERGRIGSVRVDVTNEAGEFVASFEGLAYRKF